MEPSRVELLSKLGIHLPLIHRLIPANPWGENHLLSQMVGCFSYVLGDSLTKEKCIDAPVGVNL